MLRDPMVQIGVYLTLALALRGLTPGRRSNTLLTAVLMASVAACCHMGGAYIENAWGRGSDLLRGWWPAGSPQQAELDQEYSDLELLDQEGSLTRLSQFRGKVLLIEFVGMSCPACVAFSGGNNWGPFDRIAPQANLDSIRNYVTQFGNADWNDPSLVFIQVLLFNTNMEPPTLDDAQRWAKHFSLRRSKNRIVLIGDSSMATAANRELIPGFHLVDRDFRLAAESSGENPGQNLYTDLLPKLGDLLRESGDSSIR